MSKIICFAFGLILSMQVVGQPLFDINQFLKNREFQGFKNYIDSAPRSNVKLRWEIIRELLPDIWEGVVKIEESRNANDGTGGSILLNYRIKLLAAENEIFYYDYSQTKYFKNTNNDWKSYDTTLTEFKDSIKYEDFKSTFSSVYGLPIASNDLFETSIVFGYGCGIGGTAPEYYQKMEGFIRNRDKLSIYRWLRSANSEKQLYAVLGIRTLGRWRYSITDEDKLIIEIIKSKKGFVNTCSGCFYSNSSFQDVISEMDSLIIDNPFSDITRKWCLISAIALSSLFLVFLFRTKYKR
jgi:hypothetical protein